MLYNTRTDLASEVRKLLSPEIGEEQGIIAREETLYGLPVVAVEIISDIGAKALGKPQGKYYTLTLPPRFERGAPDFSTAARAVGALIRRCAPSGVTDCLIAALGNPDITPDALGSLAAESVLVTRHLKRRAVPDFDTLASAALCRTGVLGTTGVESATQLRALTREVTPQLIIAVDALAGCEVEGLCRTVQISSGGIAPGSGVGNDREVLSRESLGVPVVAVGVPTVIDAAAFAPDEGLRGMFVTPRDIDALVRAAGRVIGYGINLALNPDISVEDIDLLVG